MRGHVGGHGVVCARLYKNELCPCAGRRISAAHLKARCFWRQARASEGFDLQFRVEKISQEPFHAHLRLQVRRLRPCQGRSSKNLRRPPDRLPGLRCAQVQQTIDSPWLPAQGHRLVRHRFQGRRRHRGGRFHGHSFRCRRTGERRVCGGQRGGIRIGQRRTGNGLCAFLRLPWTFSLRLRSP